MYPKGGATVKQLISAGDAAATIGLGHFASYPAAKLLESKCEVPATLLELPIGVAATDEYVDALRQLGNVTVPASIEQERGRLLDVIGDMGQYFYGKRVAVFGDPDHVIGITRLLLELDMKPVYVITGSHGNHFEVRLHELLDAAVPEAKIKQNADLFELHQWMKQAPVDLLIGNTYGKQIARAENVPFVRFGFPLFDRHHLHRQTTLGYEGSMTMLTTIVNAILERLDDETRGMGTTDYNYDLVR